MNDELQSFPAPLKKGNSDGMVKVSPSITKKKRKTKNTGIRGEKPEPKTINNDEVVVEKTKKQKTNCEIINGGGDSSSHDLKAKNKLCFGFKNGNCSNGDKCQFSHELSSQQQQQQTSRRLSNATTHSSTSKMMTTTKNAIVNDEVPTAGNNGLSTLLSDLPVSPFPLAREKKRTRFSIGGGSQLQSRDVTCSPPPPPLPEPIHSFSDAWDTLVDLTCSHPMYSKHFLDVGDDDRVQALPCNERCRANSRESTYLPQVIALDCEMCMVEDPESGIRNGKELLRLSVVDGRPQKKGKKGKLEPRVTLLDTLVKPSSPIVQMRSAIHGIIEQDLENVKFTKDHGRTALLKLSCPKTVIVGHALHNDLDALMLNHTRVVDTALLFGVKGEPEATPSLRDVSKALLGTAIQDGIHDSVRRDGFTTESFLNHL